MRGGLTLSRDQRFDLKPAVLLAMSRQVGAHVDLLVTAAYVRGEPTDEGIRFAALGSSAGSSTLDCKLIGLGLRLRESERRSTDPQPYLEISSGLAAVQSHLRVATWVVGYSRDIDGYQPEDADTRLAWAAQAGGYVPIRITGSLSAEVGLVYTYALASRRNDSDSRQAFASALALVGFSLHP